MLDLNDFIAPDMQKILLFLVPALCALGALVMNMSRGFSIPGTVFMIVCGIIAIFFAPGVLDLF